MQSSSFKSSIAKDEQSSEGVTRLPRSLAVLAEEPARALASRLLRLNTRDVRIGRRPIRAAAPAQRLRNARSSKAETPTAVHRGQTAGGTLLGSLQALFHSGELSLESVDGVSIYLKPPKKREQFCWKETYRWLAWVNFSWLSWSKLSRLEIRSFRAINLRSAMATSFFKLLFCSTNCR